MENSTAEHRAQQHATDGGLAAVAFLAPSAAFEIWKLFVLGIHLYIVNPPETLSNSLQPARTHRALTALRVPCEGHFRCTRNHAVTMQQHSGHSPITLLVIAALVGWNLPTLRTNELSAFCLPG